MRRCCAWPRPGRSTTASPPSSGGCSTTRRRSSRTSSRRVERTSRERGDEHTEPGAAHRRPARRAGAGHHDRRRLPLLRHAQAEVHHRRHPRAHPVHAQHGHRRVHRRPRPDPGRRPQGDRSSRAAATRSCRRCSASRTSCCASTRWTSSTGREDRFEEIKAEFRGFAMKLDVHDLTFIPVSALHGDNVVDRSHEHALVRGHARCCTTSRRCTSRRTATSSTPASRCST